jgi:hypothetical protein
MSCRGMNPGPCDKKPSHNHLSSGEAYCNHYYSYPFKVQR